MLTLHGLLVHPSTTPGMRMQTDIPLKGFQGREAVTHRNVIEYDVCRVGGRVSVVKELCPLP